MIRHPLARRFMFLLLRQIVDDVNTCKMGAEMFFFVIYLLFVICVRTTALYRGKDFKGQLSDLFTVCVSRSSTVLRPRNAVRGRN